jgi:hypothetical protein
MRPIPILVASVLALAACNDRQAAATATPAPVAAAPASAPGAKAPAATPASSFALRIDCAGEKDVTDSAGRLWLSDQVPHPEFKIDDGMTVRRDAATVITGGTIDKDLYLTERWGPMTYHIVVPAGRYEVVLHHCETFDEIKAGDRIFSVKIQGKPALTDFDVYKEAGGRLDAAVARRIPVTVTSGTLDIEFIEQTQQPEVNAIEVLAAP